LLHSYNISFDLIVSLKSAVMSFSLKIDGVAKGSASVTFK